MGDSLLFQWVGIRFLLQGMGTTVGITLTVLLVSLTVGFIMALLYLYGPGILRLSVKAYIEVFRNTPPLLWIMVLRFLVPLPLMASGILSMSLVTICGIEEDFRSGINMIPRGQWEAAASQGMGRFLTLRYVILPQVIKRLLPILLTEAVTVVKQSSFLWVIGIQELTGKGMILVGRMSETAEICLLYGMLALLYYVLNELILQIAGRLRQRQS